jgi:hypothetical protein
MAVDADEGAASGLEVQVGAPLLDDVAQQLGQLEHVVFLANGCRICLGNRQIVRSR